jgi:hypothetical protein
VAFLAITEFDTYGQIVATQQVPINTPNAVLSPPSSRWAAGWASPSNSGNLSAPFQGSTVMVSLVVQSPTALCYVTFGQGPVPSASGDVIYGSANPTVVAVTGGSCLAVL